MTDIYSKLEGWARANLTAITDEIAEVVRHESPSRDTSALATLATKLETRYRDAGGLVTSTRSHLQITFGKTSGRQQKPALILGHFDTVWPIGALSRMPVLLEYDRMSGPGIFDMKTSLVMIPSAMRAIQENGFSLPRRVEVLLTSDEEIGSPTSRDLIESLGSEAAYVLVLEPPLPGGRLKTERKGVGHYRVEVTGKSAHAGIEPERGASAIVELAHQILMIQGLSRPECGTTVNVGVIEGGTTPNVVAEHASAVVDVRVSSIIEARRIENAFSSLTEAISGTSLHVTGNFRRPPMEKTARSVDLFCQARQIGTRLGLDLGEGSTGGASDGNFTSAMGIPTLDGLGCPGDGAHAPHEHIDLSALPGRIALIAALLLDLKTPEAQPHE